MPEASVPTHDDVLAVLASLGHRVGVRLEAILDPRPSARPLAQRVALALFHERHSHEARTIAVLSEWLACGRTSEDAAATARLAAALIRLLRDTGRHLEGAAGWMPQDADLRRVDLRGEDLRGVMLRGAVLDDATLHGADLEGAVLSGARLDRTDLGATRLWDARLDDVTGTDTLLEHVDAHRCDFRRSRFIRPRMCLSTFTACRWTGAALHDAEVGPTLVVDSDPPERAPGPPRPRWMVRPVSWTAALPQALSWSPDGRTFVMGSSSGSVLFVDATTGRMRRALEPSDRPIGSIWPSPDGDAIATVGPLDRAVRVWSTQSGELQLELGEHGEHVSTVAWSPRGDRIATAAGDGSIQVWSARDGALQRVLTDEGFVSAVRFLRDDQLVTAKWADTLRLWDVSSGEVRCDLSKLAADGAPSWSCDGERLAAVGSDGVLRIWEASNGELRLSAPGFAPRSTVAWSPGDDRLAVIGEAKPAGRMQIVDARDASPQVLMSAPTGLPWQIGWSWSPRGDRLVTITPRILSLWNAHDGERCASFPTRAHDRVRCLWSPDGAVLGVARPSGKPQLELRDGHDGQHLSTLDDCWPVVTSVTWLAEGRRLFTRHDDDTFRWWDLRNGALLRALTLPWTGDGPARPSPDGRWLACIEAEGVLYDLEHDTSPVTFALPKRKIERLAWSLDGRRLACRAGSWLGIWDVEAGAWLEPWEHVRTKDGRYGNPIAWSPDGRRLAVGHDCDVTVIDVDSGEVVLELTGAEGPLRDLAWSPDGTRLAGAVHGHASPIWSTRDGTIACALDHELEMLDIVVSVSWAPHGRALATASISGTVWTWSADDGHCMLTLRLGGSKRWQVAWSPDGTCFATNGGDVQLWDAATGALVAQLHAEGEAWLVSVVGGGFARGSQRPRVMFEVEQPHGHVYLPPAGILERSTPALVEAALAGRSPESLADALGWSTQPAWEGGVQRLTWVDEPEGAGES